MYMIFEDLGDEVCGLQAEECPLVMYLPMIYTFPVELPALYVENSPGLIPEFL